MPLIVLSADRPWGPQIPGFIEAGLLPADVPPDFGYVTDRAQKEAQAKLAETVPGAKHITGTDSGHEIHKDQPRLVLDSIREVVDAVRDDKAWLVPRFEPAPCPKLQGAEALADASCGYLVVPENRSQPTGRTIRLMVAKYPARSPDKRPDPVVYLAGGPGDIAPLEINGLIAADFIRDRDIFVVSQRGTMFSDPALTCASIDDVARELLGFRFSIPRQPGVWKVPAAPEAMHQPVASNIPTLLVSGSFDTLTSLAGAEAAAASLSNATIISVPGIGHFVSPWSPCARAVIVSFLADPQAPDTSCVAGLKPQTFAAPDSPRSRR
jgi:hypothetical protein